MQLETLGSLIKLFDFIGNTGMMIAAGVALILSVLVCFLGLRGIRILMALYGFIIGFAAGFSVAHFMEMSTVIAAVIGAIAGILLAVIAFNLYIALVFIGVWAGVAAALIKVIPMLGLDGIPVYVISVVAGLLVGIIVLKIAEIIIILLSSIGGGFGAASCVGFLFPVNTETLTLILGVVLSVIGLILQFSYYFKKRKQKNEQKAAVKQEMKKSKEAQVEEAMNILDLEDDDDFEVLDDEDDDE